jgi:tetratricopeptide (TPR) repeat protein
MGWRRDCRSTSGIPSFARSGAVLDYGNEGRMSVAEQIKTLLKEADLYQRQGLLNEAKERYKKATNILKENSNIANSQDLISAIVKKVVELNQKVTRINQALSKPEVSERKQDLIKNLFGGVRADDEPNRHLEGAIALAKFGQFERALEEFEQLLQHEGVRVAAAKNIIRCHLELSAPQNAIGRYGNWVEDDRFTPTQLSKIRFFLEQRLNRLGVKTTLPERAQEVDINELEAETVEGSDDGTGALEMVPTGNDSVAPLQGIELPEEEEEFLDINSVGIQIKSGPNKGHVIEFDVSFQTGNAINLIIPSKEKELLEELNAGAKLQNMQFFSPIAILNGSGVVTAKTRIKSGPKEGDYSLDITILTT